MTKSLTLPEIAARIAGARVIWIVTHRRPDADAVGSTLGLKWAIEQTAPAKTVRAICADPIPERLAFLARGAEWLCARPFLERPDLLISVDIASRKLLGDLERELADEVDIKIDHHESGDDFAPCAQVDPSAAATGEIICRLLPHLDRIAAGEGKRAIADALYAAIASDTGGFRYSNVTPLTLRTAADLLEMGADGAMISHSLFESKGHDEIRAQRAAYENMTFHEGGRIALTVLSIADMERWEIDEEVLGVVSSLPREIRGVELGIVLRQSQKYPDTFKISMRSGEGVNVSDLCARFGGGGHARAAGGEMTAHSPKEAKEIILRAAKEALT